MISRMVNLNSSDVPAERRVSPVLVHLRPKMTPIEPNGSSSTSVSSEVYNKSGFETFSFWFLMEFDKLPCRVTMPIRVFS